MQIKQWIGLAAALAAGVVAASASRAATLDQSLDKLAAEAAKHGSVIWYESSPDNQAREIAAAFSKRFPNVKLEHVRLVGGNAIGGRIVQESQGGARTADLALVGNSLMIPLEQRQLLKKVDWQSLGVPAKLTPSPYAITGTAVFYVILYNTNLVKPEDAPKGWNDVLDPRWKGKIGVWVRAEGETALAAVWGADKVADFIKKLNANKPIILKSTFPLAQQVGAGELSVGLGIYHTAQPPLRKGAPLKIVIPDPTPVDMLYNVVPAHAQNPAGGELLGMWLATPEGAKAYEDATSRGNPLIRGTKTEELLRNVKLAEFPPSKAKVEAELAARFNKLLQSGATE